MKKTITIALIAACAGFGGWAQAADTPLPSKVIQSTIFVKGVEKDGDKDYEENPVSISRAQKDSICWGAYVQKRYIGKPLSVTETFQLPDSGVFNGDGKTMKVTSSNDGKTWTIKSKKTASKADLSMFGGCWQATDTDPLGDYTLTVKIGSGFQQTFTYSMEP